MGENATHHPELCADIVRSPSNGCAGVVLWSCTNPASDVRRPMIDTEHHVGYRLIVPEAQTGDGPTMNTEDRSA